MTPANPDDDPDPLRDLIRRLFSHPDADVDGDVGAVPGDQTDEPNEEWRRLARRLLNHRATAPASSNEEEKR